MPLNIKNPIVERLAGDVAKITHETKTEAIRRALEERKARLKIGSGPAQSKERLIEFFERAVWPKIPPEILGKAITKQEREDILGYGPHGV